MPTDQLELLEELSGGELYSSAIFGTYTFDGEFFEEDVLPVLDQLDIANIVVLTDTKSYAEAESVTEAGQSYYLEHVRCPKIHHPKFSLLLGHDHGRMFLGSGNLTEDGWQRSGELMTVIDYPDEQADTQPIFSSLRRFIENSQTRMHSSRALNAIDEAFRDAPWLSDTTSATPGSGTELLHNHSEPLLPQILDRIDDTEIEEITVCSPFFSGTDQSVFDRLCAVDPGQITLNIQPDNVEGFDSAVFDSSVFDQVETNINKYSLTGEDSDRYLHAKLLLFKSSSDVWAFFGSPNFTTPALLEDGDTGNIEMGILRHEQDPEYFSYLLDDTAIESESVTPDSVTFRPPGGSETSTVSGDFSLLDAYLEDDGTLILEYDQTDPEHATIHLTRSASGNTINIDVSNPTEKRIEVSKEQIEQFCNQSVEVSVTLEYQDRVEHSSKRWVSLPSLEQTPRPSEIKTVETSDGRDGLIEVLDRLPTLGYVCDFLENIDIADMSVDTVGGTVTIGEGTVGGSGKEEWDPKSRDELVKSKLQTLLNRFHSTQGEILLTPSDPDLFSTFVNQYVAVSKLVLWYDTLDQYDLHYVQHIRSIMKEVHELIEVINRYEDPEAARRLENDHSLLEHTAIIICYVDELQTQAGYDSGADENVYRAFQKTNRRVLNEFSELRESTELSDTRLEDCLEEYEAIDAISLTTKQIKTYCRSLLDDE